MAYTRKFGSSDKVTIDGTDVSNSFSTFGRTSSDAVVEAGGFNTTGVAEQMQGQRTQGFAGTAWYTEELAAIVEPIHAARSTCTITWQPNGLVDPTREIYSGLCRIPEFSPSSTFGDVMSFPFSAVAADSTGITVGNWT